MADKTSIEWTNATWNWATGCTKISPGCDNCYMYRLYPRLKAMGNTRYKAVPSLVTVHEDLFDVPLAWREPRMIFTCSMSDFFHETISDESRDRALLTMNRTPQHTYQILTKRAYIMKRYGDRIGRFPGNLWLGVSVEDARFKSRMEHLRQADAGTKFLSIEPLIGPVGKLDLEGIDWVIAGGESGPHHRPLNLDWARDIRDQCLNQRVAFFFKQVGGARAKSGGRLLDGQEWNQYPDRVPKITAR